MTQTVLVRRRSLGDVVLLGAVTAALPGLVTVITSAPFVEVARRLQGVDRVWSWPPPREVPGRVVDLERSLRTLGRFPGARRVHKHTLARWRRLLGVGPGRPAVTALYAAAAGVQAQPAPWIRLPPAPRDALVLVPGASTALKAPPAGVLATVGRRWSGPVVVLGGPREHAVVEQLAGAVRGARPVAEAGFAQTWAWLARAAAVVGGDTGLLHLAAATGAPTVVLAGPTHPDDGFWPAAPHVRVVQRSVSCRPCTLHRGRRCRFGDRLCLAISPGEVERALEEVRWRDGCC